MFYRKMQQQLNRTWGNPAGVWQHGGRIGFRKRAGAKGGYPLTLQEVAIRKLDGELVAAEKAAARASDPRDDFETKYSIYEGAAHINSQNLLDLINRRVDIPPLKGRVNAIHISDGFGGVEATFIFGDEAVFTEEYGHLETITADSVFHEPALVLLLNLEGGHAVALGKQVWHTSRTVVFHPAMPCYAGDTYYGVIGRHGISRHSTSRSMAPRQARQQRTSRT